MAHRLTDRPLDRSVRARLAQMLEQSICERTLPKKLEVSLPTLHRAALGLPIQATSADKIELYLGSGGAF
jgi:hypothetical protein